MNPLQMVDLKSQYLRIKNEIDAAILDVVSSAKFIQGPEVSNFERNLSQYVASKHVISCANGTDALYAALLACGVGPEDEVVTTPFTFISTVEVILLLGAKPVLVDVGGDDFLMNPDLLEAAITPKTKAIIPVHLFGQCADMEIILKIADFHKIKVIEDACQSLGSVFKFSGGSEKQSGTMGDLGCTSFFPTKNLGCFGDGGAVFTSDDVLAEKVRMICRHGSSRRYHHEMVGINSRLDTVQAAILDVKLRYLDCYIKSRRAAADFYDNNLADVEWLKLPSRNVFSSHTFHQYTVRIDSELRGKFCEFMQKNGVPTMIYYPIPVHLQKAYSYLQYPEGSFPVSERLCNEVVSLPMHTELTPEQLQYICQTIVSFPL